jgi:putative transposase
VFSEDEDFRKFLEIVGRYKDKSGFRLYHWVLMNSHFHFLLEVPEQGSLSKIMQGINLAYTLWFNRKYRRVGHVWQDRFKSFLVQRDSRYILACGRYIERNPVRAGLVGNPGDYPWSSFQVHAARKSDGITDTNAILLGEFGSGDSYSSFVCSCTDREEQELRASMAGGIIGETSFCEVIAVSIQKARRRRRGRPRKN